MNREAHAEGVDAATARDQQALARPLGRQQGEAEQAGEEGDRHRHPARGNPRGGKPAEAKRALGGGHDVYNPGPRGPAPGRPDGPRQRRFGARSSEGEFDGGIDGDGVDYETRSEAYQRLQREVIDAQRDRVIELRDRGEINDDVLRRIETELDLEDSRLEI